jgi:hypothetical protein
MHSYTHTPSCPLLLKVFDFDGSGNVSYLEFIHFVRGDASSGDTTEPVPVVPEPVGAGGTSLGALCSLCEGAQEEWVQAEAIAQTMSEEAHVQGYAEGRRGEWAPSAVTNAVSRP